MTQQARARELADAFRIRLAEGTAEPPEELLARHPDLREVLEPMLEQTLALTAGSDIPDEDSDRPEHIGPYKILDVLGEGGMGTVYVAEQKEPVRRRVALKVIKLGMDSKEVLARFEAERQALAMMQHDNIAKVLDAGTTETGQPYFAMEHVPGLPLTEYCDRHRLSTPGRLELFRQVCGGVQHAHQKGVIHRDLKPSNILVSESQGKGVPKIIDFGVAKATDHRLTEATIFTAQGHVIGTPEYMSPEQAEMSSADIDTRTDIYSLGVILYELLVGELPFSSADLRRAGLLEIQRKIREDEPPKPSTKLTGLGKKSQHSAQRRRTTVASLMRELRGDLDWIVMRALEKDRNRRYATPVGLAEDISRYLNHEPILAGPPSAVYRMRKFAQKYRAQVIAAALVVVALIAGGIGTTVFAVRAEQSAELAREERDRAEELANFMLFDLRDRLQPIGRLDLLEDVVRKTREYYENRPDDDLTPSELNDRATSLTNLGDVLFNQGYVQDALTTFRDALELRTSMSPEDLAQLLQQANLSVAHERIGDALLEQGNTTEALASYTTSFEILDRLAREAPQDTDRRHRLYLGHQKIGDVHVRRGELTEALERFQTCLEITRSLSAREPENPTWKDSLAVTYNRVGNTQKAQRELEAALASYRESLEIRAVLMDREPANVSWQRDVAVSLDEIAVVLLLQGNPEEALESFEESLEITRRLADRDPTNLTRQRDLSVSHQHVANALRELGDPQGAMRHYEAELEIDQRLTAFDPSNMTWKGDLAATHNQIGALFLREGDLPGALPHFRSALELLREVADRDPSDAIAKRNLAVGHQTLGLLQMESRELDQAKTNMVASLRILEELVAMDPTNAAWEEDLGKTHGLFSTLLMRRGELRDAETHCQKGVEILRRLVTAAPHIAEDLQILENQLSNIRRLIRGEPQTPMEHLELAYILQRQGDHVLASESFSQAFADTDIFGDLGRANLFNAARSASQASASSEGEVAAHWKELALFWLEADLRIRATLLAEIERRLANQPDAEAELEAARRRILDHFERARTGDPDLASLRGMPEFAVLFAKYDR